MRKIIELVIDYLLPAVMIGVGLGLLGVGVMRSLLW